MSAVAGFINAKPGSMAAPRRTHQHVRRHSPFAGGVEVDMWLRHNRFSRGENNAWMTAAEKLEHETKLPGKRNGALGYIGLKVLRFLLRLRGKKDGRLDPSIAWIAGQVRHARSAVAKALARLKDAGFLEWMRRSAPVEVPEPGGQYVEQISNAYFLKPSREVAEMIRRLLRRPSEAMRRVEIERERARKAGRPVAETIDEIQDTGLAQLLRELAEGAHDDAESANPPGGHNPPLQDQ